MAKCLEFMYFPVHALYIQLLLRLQDEKCDIGVTFSGDPPYIERVLLMEAVSSLSQSPDEELMDMFRLGNPVAFEVLYTRHAPRVFGYLKKRVHNEQLAKDLFQETFLRLHKTRARYNSKKNFSAWLFTLCRHGMIDALRVENRSKRLVEFVEDKYAPLRDESLILKSEEICPELLSILNPRERNILHLRFEEDLSFASISDRIGLSLVNVRKIASRAVKRLRGVA